MVFMGLIGCGPIYLCQSQKQRSWDKEQKQSFSKKEVRVQKDRESTVKSLSHGKDLQVLRGQRYIVDRILVHQNTVEKVTVNKD